MGLFTEKNHQFRRALILVVHYNMPALEIGAHVKSQRDDQIHDRRLHGSETSHVIVHSGVGCIFSLVNSKVQNDLTFCIRQNIDVNMEISLC